MEKFVGGDGDKVDIHMVLGAHHADLPQAEEVAVEGLDLGPEDHRGGVLPVFPRGHPVGSLEGPGEGLLGRKAVGHPNVQQAPVAVPDLLQGKGQLPPPQVIPEGHAGDLFKLPGGVKLGVSQALCQRPQGQELLLPGLNPPVDGVHDGLYLPLPLIHGPRPLSFPGV